MLPLVAGQPLPSVSLFIPHWGCWDGCEKKGGWVGVQWLSSVYIGIGLLSGGHCLLAVDDVPRTIDMPLLTP